MDQKYIQLYDNYIHSAAMTRRDFLDRLTRLAGSATVAATLLPMLESNYARAETVPAGDPRLETGYVEYPAGDTKMRAYLAAPKGKKNLPAVIVIHENRGLNAHIEDVARRAALEGFLALAPDALGPMGGTPADTDKARELFEKLNAEETRQRFLAAIPYLEKHPSSNGKVGCVGFCWGGGMANQLAVGDPTLKTAVAFYGMQPAAADVPKIKAALMLHYAGLDERIDAGIPAFEAALKAAHVDYRLYMYEGVNHAFHNDTNEARYNAAAAKLAWQRSMEFLKEKLA